MTTCARKSGCQARSRPATAGTTKNKEDRAPRSPAKPPDAPELDKSWHGESGTRRTRVPFGQLADA
eukprot:9941914-Alexandrium_andersonii.AAC.1